MSNVAPDMHEQSSLYIDSDDISDENHVSSWDAHEAEKEWIYKRFKSINQILQLSFNRNHSVTLSSECIKFIEKFISSLKY